MYRFISGMFCLVYNSNFCLSLLPSLLMLIILHLYFQLVSFGRCCHLLFLTHLKHYVCLSDEERIQPIMKQQKLCECFQPKSQCTYGKQGSQPPANTDHFGEMEDAHEPPTILTPTWGFPRWKPHPRKWKAGTASDGLQTRQCLLLLNIINKWLNNTSNQAIDIIIK